MRLLKRSAIVKRGVSGTGYRYPAECRLRASRRGLSFTAPPGVLGVGTGCPRAITAPAVSDSSGGRHVELLLDVPELAQSDPPQPEPLLEFGKQRLDLIAVTA